MITATSVFQKYKTIQTLLYMTYFHTVLQSGTSINWHINKFSIKLTLVFEYVNKSQINIYTDHGFDANFNHEQHSAFCVATCAFKEHNVDG